MAKAVDVAAFIRRELLSGPSRMKLLKLLYYAQAWHLVWEGAPLYEDDIEAWPQGPVVRTVWAYDKHLSSMPGSADALTATEQASVRAVLAFYAQFNGDQLSEFTHLEYPWRKAREGMAPDAKSRTVITPAALSAYYGRKVSSEKAIPREYHRVLTALERMTPEEVAELDDMGHDSREVMNADAGEAYIAWLESGGIGAEPRWPESQH